MKKYLIYILIFSLFLLGTICFKKFGLTIDEGSCSQIGYANISEYNRVLSSFLGFRLKMPISEEKDVYNNLVDKDYPPFFEVLIYFNACIVSFFKGNYNIFFGKEWILFRHINVHFFYILSLFPLYLLLKKRFSIEVALLGFLITYLHPRILADSFYNSKDIPFLSSVFLLIYVWYNLHTNVSFKNILIAGLCLALSTSIRIGGIVFLPFLIMSILISITDCKKKLFYSSFLVLVWSIVLYLLFPFLWDTPIVNLIQSIRTASNFRWINEVLYNGELIMSNKLPWHYFYVWFGITTPIFVSILLLIGVLVSLIKIVNNTKKYFTYSLRFDSDTLFDSLLLLTLSIFLYKITFAERVLYDGWRQLFFLFAIFIYFIAHGIHYLLESRLKLLTSLVVCFCIFLLSLKNFSIYPFQNVYFNKIANNPQLNYELDYWGCANYLMFDFLHYKDNKDVHLTNRFIEYTKLMSKYNESYKFVSLNQNPSFIFSDLRFMSKKQRQNILNNKNEFQGKTIYETKVDGLIINKIIER